MAIIDVHTPFTLMDDNHVAHRFEAGVQEVSEFVAKHWWTKLFAEVEEFIDGKSDEDDQLEAAKAADAKPSEDASDAPVEEAEDHEEPDASEDAEADTE